MSNEAIRAEAYGFSAKEEQQPAIGYNEEEHTCSEGIEQSKEGDEVSISHHIGSAIEQNEEEDELNKEKHGSIERSIHGSVKERMGRKSKP